MSSDVEMSDVSRGRVDPLNLESEAILPGEELSPALLISKEMEEELLSGNIAQVVEETKKNQILDGAALKGVKPVSTHNTRAKARALESSSAPNDVISRVHGRLDELRGALREREVNTKKSNGKIAEFEALFDKERAAIDDDLQVIDSQLVASANYERELRRVEGHYSQTKGDLKALNDEMVEALRGTDFTRVEELRFKYNELRDLARMREEDDKAVLRSVGVESMRELVEKAKKVIRADDAASVGNKIRERADELFKEVGHQNFDDIAEDVKRMREEINKLNNANEYQEEVLKGLMKYCEVNEETEIIKVVQKSTAELMARIKKLDEQLVQSHTYGDKMKSERDSYFSKLEELNQRQIERDRSESKLMLGGNDTLRGQMSGMNGNMQGLLLSNYESNSLLTPSPRVIEGMMSNSQENGGTRRRNPREGEYVDAGSGDGIRVPPALGDVAHGVSAFLPKVSGNVAYVDPALLPTLEKYDGKKEKWESFKNGFEVRFGQRGEEVCRIIVKEFLIGRALSEFNALPEGYKDRPFRECMDWLKDRLMGSSRYEAIDLERRLRELKVGGKRVEHVCQEVEYLVHKLHSELDKQEEVKQRQLIFLYESNREWYSGLLRMVDSGSSYGEMKEYLMREEYVERRLTTNRPNGGGGGNQSRAQNRGVNNNDRDRLERLARIKCGCCQGIGHDGARCPTKLDVRGYHADKQCFVCGGKGHTRPMCISDQAMKSMWRATVNQPELPRNTILPASGAFNVQQNGNGGYGGVRRGGNNATVRMLALRCEEEEDDDENDESFQQTSGKACGVVDRAHPAEEDLRCSVETCGAVEPAHPVGEQLKHEVDACGVVEIAHPVENIVEDKEKSEADDMLFVKKSQLVSGIIGGLQVEACLDTGADVNLIDKRTVDRMSGVSIIPGIRWSIQDAQRNSVKTLGTVLLDVKMEIGKECKVGFVVSEADVANILLGNGALDAMGLALRMKEEEKPEKPPNLPDSAIVLRTVYVGPGQLGFILVGGGRDGGSKVLITDREEVIEGVNDGSSVIRVPVWNHTEEDMLFEQHDTIGVWCRVNQLNKGEESLTKLLVNQVKGNERRIDWKEIKENLETCRGGKLSRRIEEIIRARADVFAVEDSDLGRLKGMKCDVRLHEGTKPIRQKERPVPFALKPALRKLLDKMMSQGVIKRSNSPWLSPVVLVKKKDGSIRICIDFRRVNEVTREDAFPLPNIENILQSLQGKRMFTVMDLSSGFWQLPLNERSAEITAFATLGELYEFSVLPFGLNISPAIFQRAMSEVLKDELSKEGRDRVVHCYIDDILVATETEEEHERVLAQVLDKLRKNGLLLNMRKCKIMVDELEYLGHKLSRSGLHIDNRKVQAIVEYKRPETMSQLSQFLGMTGYHRRFVESYAKIVQPLTRLVVTAGRKLLWTDEANEAFEQLKKRISSAPVLSQPDYAGAMEGTRPFILTTDASGTGIGAVMSQKGNDGKERPLAFFSRTLRESERGLSVVDTEALAVYEAVIRWKYMTCGTKTIIRTDHQPLVTLLKRKNVASRLLRWATELQEFNLVIEHIKGKSNVVADALSRNARTELPGENNGFSDSVGVVVNAITRSKTEAVRLEEEKRRKNQEESEDSENLKQWIADQKRDEWVVSMLDKLKEIEKGKRDPAEEVSIPGTIKRTSLADWVVHKGLLYLLGLDHEKKLYIPEGRREKFIEEIHDSPLSGHVGAKKLLQKLSHEVFWGSMLKDIQSVLKKCEKCLLANPQKKMIPPLQPLIANDRMDVVGMDLIDMGRGKNGGRYIVTIIDHFSKFGGAYVVRDKRAETVADVFISRWVCEGCRVPKVLVSDNGSELVNQIMEEIAKRFQIDRKLTLPYHSRANGLTERFNRTIVEILRRIKMRDDEWEEALPYAVFAYNSSPHGATGETPSFLMYFRDEKLPNSQLPQSNPAYTVDIDVDDYKRRMCWMIEKARAIVMTRLDNERKNMKRVYDEKHKHNMSIVPKKGDRVYVKVEPKSGDIKKMMHHFEGPYRVISTSDTTVTVERADNGLENGRDSDRRVVQWDRIRLVPREKGAPEKTVQVNAIAWEEKVKGFDFRTEIGPMSCLHPDFSCDRCPSSRRKLGEFVSESKGMKVAESTFSTLRELAVLLDCKEKWKDLSLWEAHREMTTKADSKDESSNSLKKAYRLAMCSHQVEEAAKIAVNGVIVRGEDRKVSDAISEVLARSGGRASRKNCVVMVPEDSCLQRASGALREMEMMSYSDETDFGSKMEGMRTAGSLPKSLVVLLKTSLNAAALEKMRNTCEETAKNFNIAVYVASDMLPAKMNELLSASIGCLQEKLTQWRVEKGGRVVSNFIIISSISGLLYKTHPLCSLFPLLRKESKESFEKAIKFLVDGTPMPFPVEFDEKKERVITQGKRSLDGGYRGGRGGKHKTPLNCYSCGDPGHFAWQCTKKKEDQSNADE